jgi:hypothetical protein
MQAKAGLHVGTERGCRRWRRCTSRGLFAGVTEPRGRDNRGLSLHRFSTREPLFVAWSLVEAIESAVFHSSRWVWGLPVIKMRWSDAGERLTSGFLKVGNRMAQLEVLDILRREHAARAAAMG